MSLEPNFDSWKEDNRSILESLSDQRNCLLFSGGKDSSLALDFMVKAGMEFGFDFEVHAAVFPVHRYTDIEMERLESYWDSRGIKISWHDVGVTDDTIKNDPDPCIACRAIRKRMLKTGLTTDMLGAWNRFTIIASYSLWDIVSYSIEHLLNNIYSSDRSVRAEDKSGRFLETAQRFYPLLKMDEGYSIFRPLIKLNDSDIRTMIEQEGIPTLTIPCKFSNLRPKRLLEHYYKALGLRFDYDQLLGFAKRSLGLPDLSSYASINKAEYLQNIF
jgi:tRNA(Ile)-lysidine synthase TilS/MesJ